MATGTSFSDEVLRFAVDPRVSGALIAIGILGLLIELQTLHGIAGLIGIGALVLFFAAHAAGGFSSGFVIFLALAGLCGLLLELHVIPGSGVPGLLGMLALLAAIVLAFGPNATLTGLEALVTAVIIAGVAFAVLSRILPRTARSLAFSGVQGAEYVASSARGELLGRDGHAESDLRPAGIASIDGRRVDVLSEGDYIRAGSAIRVSRAEGARIFVRSLDAP